jgi:hypothetical protein
VRLDLTDLRLFVQVMQHCERCGARDVDANKARSRGRPELQRGTKGAARTASMPKAAMFQNRERMSGIPDT